MVGTVFNVFWLLRFRRKLRISWWSALILAVLHTIVGVLCVKVFAVMETLNLEKAGNMSLFGGVFLMPVFYAAVAKLTKRKSADIFDVFTICMVFTVMCARFNCIVSGCCQGNIIHGTTDMRWPTRQAEIAFYIVLLIILGRKVIKEEMRGRIYPIYMISYGIFRFIVECFREADSPFGLVHMGHIWAVIALCLGWSIFTELNKSSKRKQRGS